MGKIVIGGTLAGTLGNPAGNIGLVELGYLWGKIDVSMNLGNVILRQGGGGIAVTVAGRTIIACSEHASAGGSEPDSWISAGGSIRGVYVSAGVMRSFVRASNNPDVPAPSNVLYELVARRLHPVV